MPRVDLVGEVDHQQLGVRPPGARRGSWPGGPQRALELRAEQQVGAEQRDPRHGLLLRAAAA